MGKGIDFRSLFLQLTSGRLLDGSPGRLTKHRGEDCVTSPVGVSTNVSALLGLARRAALRAKNSSYRLFPLQTHHRSPTLSLSHPDHGQSRCPSACGR